MPGELEEFLKKERAEEKSAPKRDISAFDLILVYLQVNSVLAKAQEAGLLDEQFEQTDRYRTIKEKFNPEKMVS